MKCSICENVHNNIPLLIQEKQYCFKESFPYFQCAACHCIQIQVIPQDIARYYPTNYYSFNVAEGQQYLDTRISFFKKIQADYLINGKNIILGKLFTLGYKPPLHFNWLRNLKLHKHHRILDVGCGSGLLLKQLYKLGYKYLTGIDPFISHDSYFTNTFNIYKKDVFALGETENFDCIMMHHSFEHMAQQKEVLEKVKSLLVPNGRLLIRIPVVSDVLLKKYNTNVVSLDAPRHFYIHSVESITLLCGQAGLTIEAVEYDATAFSFWASEQYSKDICLSDKNSYSQSRKASIFSKKDIRAFEKEIKALNEKDESDNAAFYISILK